MHNIHRVSRLRIAQIKQICFNIWRCDLVDLIYRSASCVCCKASSIDVVAIQILQRKRVGGGIGNNVVATVQFGHAANTVDVDFIAVAKPMRC